MTAPLHDAARRLLDWIDAESADLERPLLVSTQCPLCTAGTHGHVLCPRHELAKLLEAAPR